MRCVGLILCFNVFSNSELDQVAYEFNPSKVFFPMWRRLKFSSQILSGLMHSQMVTVRPEAAFRNVVDFSVIGKVCGFAIFPIVLFKFLLSYFSLLSHKNHFSRFKISSSSLITFTETFVRSVEVQVRWAAYTALKQATSTKASRMKRKFVFLLEF